MKTKVQTLLEELFDADGGVREENAPEKWVTLARKLETELAKPFTNREASIYVFALRYALARPTGALAFVAAELAVNWQRFSGRDKHEIIDETKSGNCGINAGDVAKILALEGTK